MSKERIEEVADEIAGDWYCKDGMRDALKLAIVGVLEKRPEFQEPRSPWVQCSERMPSHHHEVLWHWKNGFLQYGTITGVTDDCVSKPIAWMEIPPYVAPESELVRRGHRCSSGSPGVPRKTRHVELQGHQQ